MKIQITIGQTTLTATLADNETARSIIDALPFDLPFNTWGNEIYFAIPVKIDAPGEQEFVEIGDLAFWPPGQAFCIFYGATPVSTDERPRAASEVIVFGAIDGDATVLKNVKDKRIRIEKID